MMPVREVVQKAVEEYVGKERIDPLHLLMLSYIARGYEKGRYLKYRLDMDAIVDEKGHVVADYVDVGREILRKLLKHSDSLEPAGVKLLESLRKEFGTLSTEGEESVDIVHGMYGKLVLELGIDVSNIFVEIARKLIREHGSKELENILTASLSHEADSILQVMEKEVFDAGPEFTTTAQLDELVEVVAKLHDIVCEPSAVANELIRKGRLAEVELRKGDSVTIRYVVIHVPRLAGVHSR